MIHVYVNIHILIECYRLGFRLNIIWWTYVGDIVGLYVSVMLVLIYIDMHMVNDVID